MAKIISIIAKPGNWALIDGKEIQYNGICSPGRTLEQAKKYYPENEFEYLGYGYQMSTKVKKLKQHFFLKKDVIGLSIAA